MRVVGIPLQLVRVSHTVNCQPSFRFCRGFASPASFTIKAHSQRLLHPVVQPYNCMKGLRTRSNDRRTRSSDSSKRHTPLHFGFDHTPDPCGTEDVSTPDPPRDGTEDCTQRTCANRTRQGGQMWETPDPRGQKMRSRAEVHCTPAPPSTGE